MFLPRTGCRLAAVAFIHNSTLVRATADAIVTGIGWKYVYDRAMRVGTLYDLRTDPVELQPIESKQVAVTQTLDRILQRWRAPCNSPIM